MMTAVYRLFNIRRGEERRAVLMMTYIFLIVSSLMIIKPVSHAQFLSQFGAKQLAFVFMLVAVCAAGVVSVYGRLLEQMNFLLLIRRTLNIFTGALIFIWFALFLKFWEGFILYFFFIGVSIFAVIATSQFWILANIVFNVREAKRLFGFIGAGAIAGGILGGYFTNLLVPVAGSENLILLGALLLFGCDRIAQSVWKTSPAQQSQVHVHPPDKWSRSFLVPMQMIRSSRHLMCLAAIILISVAVAKLVDYQFNAIASGRIRDEERLAAFLGFWYSNLNVASLLIQLFITRRVVGVFGVGASLLVLPAGIFLGAAVVLVFPVLISAIFLKVADGSLKNSIQKSGIELLSLPVPPEIRNPARSFIDVFGDSFATGITGLLLLILTVILNVPVRFISLLILVLVGIWIGFVRRVRTEYLETVRRKMDLAEPSTRKLSVDLESESVIGGLIRILSGRSERRILEVLKILREAKHEQFVPILRNLLGHPSQKVRLEALRRLYFYEADFSEQIQSLIHDENTDIRTEAMQYLFQHADDQGEDMMNAWLSDPDENIYTAALLCAARESRTNQEMKNHLKIRERVEARIRDLRSVGPEEGAYQKIMCARIIGAALIPELNPFLHILFRDPSHEILQAVIMAAGQTRDRTFLPVLMRHLAQPDMEKTVREALAFYQTDVTELFVRWMRDPKEERMIRLRIPRVIANMGTQRAADVLTESLEFDDPDIRYEIVRALNHLRKTQPVLRFDDGRIARSIVDEAHLYSQTLASLRAQIINRQVKTPDQPESRQAQASRKRLIRALEKKLDKTLETIFRLLGLKYPPDEILTVYQQMRSGKQDVRTNAVEYLDNLLDWPLKRAVIPLVESTFMENLVERTLHQFGLKVPCEFDCLTSLLDGKDAQLKVDTLSLIAAVNDARYVPQVCALLSDPNKLLQVKAEKTLKQLGIV